MRLIRLGPSIAIILAFIGLSLAQDTSPAAPDVNPGNPKTAILVDEFGRVGDCDLSARVDNLFLQIQNNEGASGYVIAYAGVGFLPSQRDNHPMLARIKKQMAFRRYDETSLVMVNGGFREEQGVEFFLVPRGASPPEPTNTVEKPQIPSGTHLWGQSAIAYLDDEAGLGEEFVLPSVRAAQEEQERLAEAESEIDTDEDIADGNDGAVPADEDDANPQDAEPTPSPEDDKEARLGWVNERFGEVLSRQTGARAVIIFYADDQYCDIERLRQLVEDGRDRIAAAANIGPAQIEVVFGGYRDSPVAAYYVVPHGGDVPVAAPEARPPAEEGSGEGS